MFTSSTKRMFFSSEVAGLGLIQRVIAPALLMEGQSLIPHTFIVSIELLKVNPKQ